MRRQDKYLNIQKANLLAEERYLKSKGLIKETYPGSEENPLSNANLTHSHDEYFRLRDAALKSGEDWDPITAAQNIKDRNEPKSYMGEDETIKVGDEVFIPRDEYHAKVISIEGNRVKVDGPMGIEYKNMSELEVSNQ